MAARPQARSLPGWAAVSGAALAAGMALAPPSESCCEPGGGGGGVPWWLGGGWLFRGGGSSAGAEPYLSAIRDDPRSAVPIAFALPFLSLAFGSSASPSAHDLRAAERLLLPALPTLRPWEAAALLWSVSNLGYEPSAQSVAALRDRSVAGARAGELTAQEAAQAAWALGALRALDPGSWAALLAAVATCPGAALDEARAGCATLCGRPGMRAAPA